MRLILCFLVLLLISTATAIPYQFYASETARLYFDYNCQFIEIPRFEQVTVEGSQELQNTPPQKTQQQLNSETLEINSAEEWTIRQTTEQSSSQTQPTLNVRQGTKYFYREIPIEIFGELKKPCPAIFEVKFPQQGFYYLPIKLYKWGATEIKYIGIEILPLPPQAPTETLDKPILPTIALIASILAISLGAYFFWKRRK